MRYENPILCGFHPDPSICRVGEDYYLVTSTFEFFPGIPVYHSRDLVNWRQIGNCIDRPGQLPMDREDHGAGIWAPTIRYHEGRFYVAAKARAFGNFIISALDPAGPWSDPVPVDMGGIDPDLLFDGGRVYFTTNARVNTDEGSLSAAEVDPLTGALLSPIRTLWHGMTNWNPRYLEGPHLYHIGDWYYLLAAEGGTGYEHTITCARSRNVWGPYEDCPWELLNNVPVGDTGVACTGHGDLVQAADGSWWCVHLGTRPDDAWYSHLGRETFLLPVAWQDGWPVIADGRCRLAGEGPLWQPQQRAAAWSAKLDSLEPQWLFLRQPEMNNYHFGTDGVTMMPSATTLQSENGSPTMLLVRPLDIRCTVEAELEFDPQQEGDEAGVVMYISRHGYISLGCRRQNGRCVLAVTRCGGGPLPRLMDAPGNRITFRIRAEKDCYHLSAAGEDGVFHPVVTIPVLSRGQAGKCFTGTLFGVYAQCVSATNAQARLTRFVMTRE